MSFIKWNKELSVGIKEIDEQHKNLIENVNKAYLISRKDDKDKISEILKDLIEYVRIHFSTEEKYFEKWDYKYKEEHEKEHEKLTLKVLDFNTRFERGEEIMESFLKFLREWIENHLKKHDLKYSRTWKEQGYI